MLSLISSLMGFAAGGLPKVLDFVQDRGDKKHELALMAANREREIALAKEGFIAQARVEEIKTDQIAMQTQAQEIMSGEVIDPAAEMKQLGPNANAVVNGMVDWARGLVNKGVWSKDDFEEFKIMGGTARGLTALMKIRSAYEGRVPIESAPVEGAPSKEELYAMVGDPKYHTDPAYRQKVERMFRTYIPE